MTLTDFLLARIAEDEAVVLADRRNRERWALECEAKRLIVAEHVPSTSHRWCFVCTVDAPPPNNPAPYPCNTLRHLARPYADHHDYREEWTQ